MSVLGKKCTLALKKDLLHMLETKLRHLPTYSGEYAGTLKWMTELQGQIRELEKED